MSSSYIQDKTGIYRPKIKVSHRDQEYDQDGFNILFHMQKNHFWYRGRHRFLLSALNRYMNSKKEKMSAIDLGGGVGGWVRYLADYSPYLFQTVALADSSETALTMAESVLPSNAARYQVDVMNLNWEDHWDCAFLLDVIEHIPNDIEAVRQAATAIKSGGYLFITTPALKQFWSYNDDLAHHLHRYNRNDYINIAKHTGLELCEARYFMFFLSPLYFIARKWKNIKDMSEDEKKHLMAESHKTPIGPVNTILTALFAAETPVGHLVPFPWGTSILGVFRKQ